MHKILIHLVASLTELEFDVFVPGDLPVRDLVPLLHQSIYSINGNRGLNSGEEILCSARLQKVLAPDGTLDAYGIQNGDVLHLI